MFPRKCPSFADACPEVQCVLETVERELDGRDQDIEDDLLVGVKSTARLFGKDAPRWLMLFYAASFALIATAGLAAHLGPLFLLLMLLPAAHFFWQTRRLRIDRPMSIYAAKG